MWQSTPPAAKSGPSGSCLRRPYRLEPRYQIVAACFLATFTAYVERVGFSIAFTEMAKAAGKDESVKGTVLSAFFWGYAVSQVCRPGLALQSCQASA
jgi:sugar phosphate permease